MASPSTKRSRTKNPRGHGDQLRLDLVAAANAILDRTGDAADVTVRGVAAAVGVAPNAVYLHFADRDELLAAVAIDRFTAFAELMRSAADAAGDDAVARFHAGHRAYIDFALEHPGHYRLLFGGHEVTPASPELAAAVREVAYAAFEVCVDACRRLVEAGVVGAVEPVPLAHLVWTIEHGYADLARTDKGSILPPPDVVIDTLLAAVRADPELGAAVRNMS